MSVSTGTATSYLDLLSKLRTFLTTDATLTAASQNWTELATNSTPYSYNPGTGNTDTVDFETYLKAPGLSGSLAYYVNIRAYHNTSNDYYNWQVKGAKGYSAAVTFDNQPGVSPGASMYLWNQNIPYWFIANGQRCIVIAKVSAIYECMYFGAFFPYGTPGQYPYPLMIGGCGTNMDYRFSNNNSDHTFFADPQAVYICHVDGSWQQVQNASNGNYPTNHLNMYPFNYCLTGNQVPTQFTTNADGSYFLDPCVLAMTQPALNLMGELDGVAFVPGFAQASENTITVGGNTYLVFQNTFRTGANNYMAVLQA